MAEASISVDQDQFSCPVCLDLLKDPVTTPCGHSFCMVCINGCWDQNQRGVYSCPQCRETFTPRPVLRRNTMLAEVVEELKKTEVQAASPAHCYAGPGDVECDSCTGRKRKAIKSCLVCLTSYCEAHLKPHYQSPAFKKHKLVEASKQLQEKICSQHDKLIEIYCRTDQQMVCYLCTMDSHKGHDTVAAIAERSEKQNELKEVQRRFQQRLLEKEKKLQEVKRAVKTLKSSAQAAVEDSERIFAELIRSIEKKRCEVTELIRAQEEAELSGAEELLEHLEQEIADLKRRDTELEQISHTEDHVHFLQVGFLEAGISKLRHVRRGTAWIAAEPLADMVVLRSVRPASQVLDQLRSDLSVLVLEYLDATPVKDCQSERITFPELGVRVEREAWQGGGFSIWAITPEERSKHDTQFDSLSSTLGYVSGYQLRKFFLQSGLPASVLAEIWALADMGRDGKMDRLEFSIAMKLIKLKLQGQPLPSSLPIIMKQMPN
ncbi:hypothetical protein AOLI_G00039530 [Acnodon oligacanthus]